MLEVLSVIAEKLNTAKIVWAVGGSILLKQYGLIQNPLDIDIFVHIDDIGRADETLGAIGQKKQYANSRIYSTKHFFEYEINGIGVDVMSGLAIRHSTGVFKYQFDHHSITEIRNIHGTAIPFTSLEDWYVIYQLIPNRESKVKLIKEYLLSNKIKYAFLLERTLQDDLPEDIKVNIRMMLDSAH